MIVARTDAELATARAGLPAPVALVPTMGALHEGHLSLIRRAKEEAASVVVSVYVNPIQFGPNEDFAAYPRTPEEDLAACRNAGVDLVWMPETLYPAGEPLVRVHPGPMADCLCGAVRPGHFAGVLTVVAILFHMVRPDLAVFGEKDWQQLVLIRRMVQDLRFPVNILGAPTVREPDGLAMSSRNRYLTKEERGRAVGLVRALSRMRKLVQEGERAVAVLEEEGARVLQEHGVVPEYLQVRDGESLARLKVVQPGARAFVAARIGRARLIDNMALL